MKSKELIVAALKVGAVIIIVNALEKFPLLFGYYKTETGISAAAFVTMSLIPLIFSFLTASIMWFAPNFLLKYLFVRDRSEDSETVKNSEIGHLAVSLIGLYILTTSTADMVYHISFFNECKRQLGRSFTALPQDYASFIATISELILGLLLIFGTKPIYYLITKIKSEFKSNAS